jgi:hypothetical protein
MLALMLRTTRIARSSSTSIVTEYRAGSPCFRSWVSTNLYPHDGQIAEMMRISEN